MIKITFPDGSVREYNEGVTGLQIAESISSRLAQDVLACGVNGEIYDLGRPIMQDAEVVLYKWEDEQGKHAFWHTSAHLLAEALQELYSGIQFGIGPAIENGFYYDVDPGETTIKEADLPAIEKKMAELVAKKEAVVRQDIAKADALKMFGDRGETYKCELISELEDGHITTYTQGAFTDLCRGPHLMTTAPIKAIKLTSVAGAYWRGQEDRKMMTRIYGITFPKKKMLDEYLVLLEEAKKRDHRKIGKQLDLYHMQEEAPGMVFWHNDGWTIFRELEVFVRSKLKEYQYQEVKGPFMMDRVLWEKTGHWDNYKDAMFTTSSENREYCIKPMNCPGHVQIFNQGLKSYRDLPLRMAEFGSCHRNEPSGSLHGLMRVRGFTQDDAHIFCTEEQIRDEVNGCIRLVYDMYSTFGFEKIVVKLSTRPEKRIGSDEMWDRAEADLAVALEENNIPFEYQLGEGAFYGPKIEFTLYDCLDRAWQCGTVQLDFSLPSRLSASYVGEDNERKVPVMIHRAILGSMERFIGILTEEFAGFFPTWLAPVQVVIMNITDSQSEYVNELTQKLSNAGIRVKADLRNEKIGFKIREHTLRRVPYMLVCGDKEVESGKVAVRTRRGKDLGSMDVNEVIEKLQQEIRSRSLKQLEE